MLIQVKEKMKEFVTSNAFEQDYQFADVKIDTQAIKAIMINEVVPSNPEDDFYGKNKPPFYLTTTLPLFSKAGFSMTSIEDVTKAGIYITNAVKIPKKNTTIEKDVLEQCIPILEYEISLFPNVSVIMLMGDVAKKAFNHIAKSKTKKNVIPTGATYKLRTGEFYYENIRVFPSYIMTGGNILIEKSKVAMASEDIQKMWQLIQ